MILKFIQDFCKGMETWIDKIQEKFNKDEQLKNKQRETDTKITEIKNTLPGISSRITEAEEWKCDQEDIMVEITAVE